MADEPDPNAGSTDPGEPPRSKSSSRRKSLTPELRRFLGPARSWHEKEAAREEAADPNEPPEPERSTLSNAPPASAWPGPDEPAREPAPKLDRPKAPPASAQAVLPDQKISRALEMQKIVLVFGALIVLGGAFYAGTKVQKVKAFLASRNKPEITNVDVKKFPGLSTDELVEQALAAERLGNWHEAVERLLVAKRRDVHYRDTLFHAGKLCYDHGDFDSADRLLERAIAYGEQVDTANYLRGLIALGRNDLATAEQLFEAAIDAEPFTPGYYYNLGDVLRREHRPKEAVTRYEQAASRTLNEQDAALCRFKARMAKAETVDRPELENEVEHKRSAGPLSVDWILTDAALKIVSGKIGEATQLIQQARSLDDSRLGVLFSLCTADMLFTEAATNHPEIADASRVGSKVAVPTPTPFGSP